MSEIERLVLEKQDLIRQLINSEAVFCAILRETGPMRLKIKDIEAERGNTVVVKQTKTLLKLEAPDDTTSM